MKLKIVFIMSLLLINLNALAETKSVRVVPIQKQKVISYELVFGTVVSEKNTKVATEVSGKVLKIKVLGSQVKKGDLLAKIDDRFLHIELNKFIAKLNRYKAEKPYLDSLLEATLALNQSNSISTSEYQRILSHRNINQQKIQELDEEINTIKEKINRSKIIAPFDGIVTEQFTQVGEVIGIFQPIVRLLDNNNLALHVEAPIALFHNIKIGMEVNATDKNKVFTSRVITKYPVDNLSSRKFILRTQISNEYAIGSSIKVNLPKNTVDDAFVIPFDALIKAKQGYQIAVVNTNKKVAMVDVNKLFYIEDEVAISSGTLPEHFYVITEGNMSLSEGQTVNLL
jgi:multidrug efflux system membrane fusion protein